MNQFVLNRQYEPVCTLNRQYEPLNLSPSLLHYPVQRKSPSFIKSSFIQIDKHAGWNPLARKQREGGLTFSVRWGRRRMRKERGRTYFFSSLRSTPYEKGLGPPLDLSTVDSSSSGIFCPSPSLCTCTTFTTTRSAAFGTDASKAWAFLFTIRHEPMVISKIQKRTSDNQWIQQSGTREI